MSDTAGRTRLRTATTPVVHESYSFACMRCGHGWEQSYEIEHHTDAEGQEFVLYVADGRVVPSPLRRPTCQNCDAHLVRIMRAGRVSAVRDAAYGHEDGGAAGERHHWHLSDLLHPFQRGAR
ncbi:hypothetical protein QNN03_14180 [Streptomyces sp. GXMU-J15]|uniref:C2H2-type domain-containing protein n=1 Tax=Streptomyces fuscus TaxID=3048495 RepID=A0ABT7IYA8_9ACTN|nr:hypothetical protein [Streptomyces fuscus]MDL2077584.1 hypothetical protein [Streptomyces fuscus]